MTQPSFPDHFSAVSGDYAAFRPRYPGALFDWLAEVSPGGALALDIATGNGQAALALAARFERVIGVDASAEQISSARDHPRVEYRLAPAEDTGLAGVGADLVTVAQALHWFDIEAFFAHADDCLAPGGVLAAWTYALLYFDDAQVDRAIDAFYRGTLDGCWPPERRLVEEGYRSIRWPYPELDIPDFEIRSRLSLDALIGYFGTWSAVGRYRKATGRDPLPELRRRLAAVWGEGEREAVWPLAVRAGRMPPG